MAAVHASPFQVMKKTNLWSVPILLALALIFGGLSWTAARTALALETRGIVTEGTITGRERRESRDSEGNTTVRYYVSYRFATNAGEVISRRVRTSASYYRSVTQGQIIQVRYLPDRPRTHEYRIGSFRQRSGDNLTYALLALAAAAGAGLYFGSKSAPLLRALATGETRRATVIRHIEKQRRRNTGARKGRIVWRDDTGQEGTSGPVPMLDVRGHPVGCRIIVVVDRISGKTWWEEELAGGADGMAGLTDTTPTAGKGWLGRLFR